MNTTGFKFWWLTCVNEARFALVMMRRYLFDTLVGLIAVFLLFMVVFMGLRTFLGEGLTTDTLDAVIVGYIMWMFALLAYTGTANEIIDEAKQGTLEQLFMAPAGICRLLIVRMGAGIVTAIVFNSVLLLLAMLSTGRWLQIPYLQCLSVIVLGLPAVQGLGFAIAGIALVHKRVAAVSSIMQFALIALVSVPAYPFNGLSLLPFTAAAGGVNQLVSHQAPLPLAWYGLIFASSLFYLLLGVFIFKRFEAKAKSLNVLGHY